jgi:hypothetical protein
MGVKNLVKKDRTSQSKKKETILSMNLGFELVLDPENETMQQLLALDKEQQSRLLNEMLKDLLSPPIQKALKKLNEGNAGWAVVRLANG